MWLEHPDLQSGIEVLAQDIGRHIAAFLRRSGQCTLAVSGGRSPIPLFARLAQLELDWSQVHVRLVDERYVPPEHPDSNERLVRRHLLKANAASANFRGLYVRGAGIETAVAAANAEAKPVNVALLGMGDDGHTASLFPGAVQLSAAISPEAACYLHITPPAAPHERISMSLAALQACDHRILYIAGDTKREVLRQAEKKADPALPVSLLAAEPGATLDVYWHP